MNLQVTSVIAQLSQFKHPQLQEFLLNASLPLAPDCRSLHSTLQNVSCFKIITIHYSSVTLFYVKYFTHTFTVRPVKLGFHIIFWIIYASSRDWRQTNLDIWKHQHDRNPPNYLENYLCFLSLRTETYFRWLLLSTWIHSGGEKWRPEICLCPQAMFPWASNKYYLENT